MTSTPKETTSKVEPSDEAKPYLTDIYKQYSDLIKSGAPEAYNGSTVADLSKATTTAQNNTIATASNTANQAVLSNSYNNINSMLTGTDSASKTLNSLMNSTNLGTDPSTAAYQKIANGSGSNAPGKFDQNYQNAATGQAATYGGYQNAALPAQQAQAQQLASNSNPAISDYLKNTASGQNIGNNPYLNQSISNAQDTIATKLQNVTNPAIMSGAASAGRMGSGAFASQMNNAQSAAANEMSKVATDMYANQYNQDISNQQNAANLYGNLANQDVSNRLTANQNLAATSDSQQSQRLAGTQLYGSLNDSAESLKQNAANSLNSQFNTNNQYQLQGVQGLSNNYQNNISNMLNQNNQRMNAANSQASNNLNASNAASTVYNNQYLPNQQLAAVGQAQDDRAQNVLNSQIAQWDQQQQQPLMNLANFTNILNGGGYSNTTTPVYSNTGSQILGGLTSLAGLFALCSIDFKTIHSFIGYLPTIDGNKIPMYEFSYNDSPNEKWIGPIAEEVAEIYPEAVSVIDEKNHINIGHLINLERHINTRKEKAKSAFIKNKEAA